MGAPPAAPRAPQRPHPAPAWSATGARRRATHFSRRPRPRMRGPVTDAAVAPRHLWFRNPLKFCGAFSGGARGGGGRGPLALAARRRMPLSAPLLFCHLAWAWSVMECGPVGRWGGTGDGRSEERWPRARSVAEPIVFNTNLEELRWPVICGKIKALVFNKREWILVPCNRVSSHISISFILKSELFICPIKW